MDSLAPIFLLIFALVLLAACAGWLSSLSTTPFSYWSHHPWKVFWMSYIPLSVGALLYHFNLWMTGGLIMIPGILLLYLSGIQGLRYTWQRSPKKAVIIVALAFGVLAVNAFNRTYESGDWRALDYELFGLFVFIPLWALMASIAGYVATRRVARKHQREPLSSS